MNERQMAYIAEVTDIRPIENADAIECVTINGGWDVVAKKNEFRTKDLVVYLEIDSWVPDTIAPFLSKGKEPREYNGVKGERLKTIKLRGQLSQGLILPLNIIPSVDSQDDWKLGDCVDEILNIQKWEAPISACLGGKAYGNFPNFIPKSDQPRLQNLSRNFTKLVGLEYELSEKLDGSSGTVYLNNSHFGVCSRNIEWKSDSNNSFWSIAIKYDLERKLTELGRNIAIQGEVCGPGIQGNSYNLSSVDYFVFNVYDIDNKIWLSDVDRLKLTNQFGLKHCPVLSESFTITENCSIKSLLEIADDKSTLNPKVNREGLVWKCKSNPDIQFKTISNAWLLKEK